ncbi:MAG: hypothetical protein IT239_03835, partial [Bacteroidia bacterium]|nr:hypothetical protein [Bacteroidia bacterium]
MKRKLLTLFTLLTTYLATAQTVIIPAGNPTSSSPSATIARKPYGSYYGYERSAFIYKASEIGVSGDITSISFFLDSSNTPAEAIVKIYLKEVTDSMFSTQTTVDSEETNATLVFDGTILSTDFNNRNYVTVNLTTPFIYSGTGNLKVIVENNEGGSGSENSSSKIFRYNSTGALNTFQYWQSDNNPPIVDGTTVSNRPNIKLEFTPSTPCTDPPTAGTIVSNDTVFCLNAPVTLMLNGNSVGAGQTYQWQSSTDNATWNNINSATYPSYSNAFLSPIYYRCAITCGASTVYTPAVFLNQKAALQCYCNSAPSSPSYEDIGNVTFNTINNGVDTPVLNNATVANTYSDFTAMTTTVIKGNNYPISVSQICSGSFYTCEISVNIDFNRNGVFEANERIVLGNTASGNTRLTKNITIPAGASSGATRMRVILSEDNGIKACDSYAWGETEDYTVVINDASPCSDPPVVGATVASKTTICPGDTIDMSIPNLIYGSGQTYTWQTSSDSITWIDVANANNNTYSSSFDTTTYIRCKVTCSASTYSTPLKITVNPITLCYCAPSHGGCSNVLTNISITGTTLTTDTTCNGLEGYTQLTPNITTATLTKGVAYNFSITTNNASIVSVWIDYNKNGIFEANEWFQPSTATTANVATIYSFTIPASALTGQTGMRVRTRSSGNANGSADACTVFGSGETVDFIVTIADASPCSNPPVVGVTAASKTNVCLGDTIILSMPNLVYGSGQTFAWQSSSDSITWSNITNANGMTYSASFSTTTFIRCKVTCADSTYSTPIKIYVKPFNLCYCFPSHGSCYNVLTNISIVSTGLSTNATCSGNNGYTQLAPGAGTTATLIKGLSYDFSITTNNSSIASVWIDYNQNGVFEASEWFQPSTATTANVATVYNFTVPVTALSGQTGMRVRTRGVNNPNAATDACSLFGSGETVDFVITLDDPGPCTDPPTGGNTVANKTEICPAESVTLSLQGNTYGSGQTYTWQSSTDNATWTDINGANQAIYTTNSLNVTTYFKCILKCGVGTAYSTTLLVTVKPFNLCYCTTNIQSNNCDNTAGILGVEVLWQNFINYNQCTNGGVAYTAFSDTNVTDNFGLNQTYTIRVTANSVVNMGMWIDYNQNGQYETSEYTAIASSQPAGTPADQSFTVPANATLGKTGMRIRTRNTSFNGTNACTSFSSGETQDYVVTIDNSVGLKTTKAAPSVLKLYPNPAQTKVQVMAANLTGKTADVFVYNINGALILKTSVSVING